MLTKFLLILALCSCTHFNQNPHWQSMHITPNNGAPILPIEIQGQKINAIFDSGAKGNMIDQSFAEFGTKLSKTVKYGGTNPNDKKTAHFYNFSKLTINQIDFENEEIIAGVGYEKNIPAILSSGFMFKHKFKIVLDYKNKRFFVSKRLPENLQPNQKFKRINSHIFVDVMIQGQLLKNFILDTGAGLSNMAEPTLKKIVYTKDENKMIKVKGTHSELGTAYSVYVNQVALDQFDQNQVEFFINPDSHIHRNKVFGVDVSGIIGANVFANKTLVIDYENESFKIMESIN